MRYQCTCTCIYDSYASYRSNFWQLNRKIQLTNWHTLTNDSFPHILLVNSNINPLKVEFKGVIIIDLWWNVYFINNIWSFSFSVYWLLWWPVSCPIWPDTSPTAFDKERIQVVTYNTIVKWLRWSWYRVKNLLHFFKDFPFPHHRSVGFWLWQILTLRVDDVGEHGR